jgi:hypothetical protein
MKQPIQNDPDARNKVIRALYKLAHEYENKRNIYWSNHRKLRFRSHCLSIPLLILTSFTAATSSAQASGINGDMKDLSIVISIFGVSSAILTALQKYLRFEERSGTSKYISKMYGLIASKVKGQIEIILAGHNLPTQEDYNKFLDDINQEAQALQLEIDIVPKDLMKYEHNKYVISVHTNDDDVDNLILNHLEHQNDLICLSKSITLDETQNTEIIIENNI